MRYPTQLIPACYLERYNRFLALVELDDGCVTCAHVPNSGALTGCLAPGIEILLTHDTRPGRKTAYTWRFARGPAGWICIDTLVPNRLVAELLAGPGLPGLPLPRKIRPEVTLPGGARLDFVLDLDGRLAFLEVKSVTWMEEGVALFPDGVTARGRRHLQHLQDLVRQGHEAWQVFVVQREDAARLRPAVRVDPAYARELAQAAGRGVRILVLREKIAPPEITLASTLPFDLT